MSRVPSTNRIAPPAIILALALVGAYAVMASGVLGGGVPVPTDPPKPTPTPTATPKPTDPPSDGKVKVVLDVVTDHKVSVLIDDQTGKLADARTGKGGDGMSVRWHESIVRNLDDSTLRLVWVGWPRDEDVLMSISEVDGKYEILITQVAPYPNTDAMGVDRELVLSFDAKVSADDVKVTFKDVEP